MNRERLSEDVYVFTSERYAQVTASLIVSGSCGILIDTLPFPDESVQLALFAKKVCPDGVRYVIYTQHQADHTYGAFLFPRAEIISHALCRRILIEKGYKALDEAKRLAPELAPVRLRLSTMTFETGSMHIRLPGKTLELFATPGHTPDSISVVLHEEKILFAGDTFMAIPTLGEGEPAQLKESIDRIGAMQLDTIVQGHGEIILRGEIKENVRRSLNYIETLTTRIQKLVEEGAPREAVRGVTLEQCGLQRVLLNGMVVPLHTANALAYYDRVVRERGGLPRPKPAQPPAAAPAVEPKKPAAQPAKVAPAKPASDKPAEPVPVEERVAVVKPEAEKITAPKPAADKARMANSPATKPPAAKTPAATKPPAKTPQATKTPATKAPAAKVKPVAKPAAPAKASRKPASAKPSAKPAGRAVGKPVAKPVKAGKPTGAATKRTKKPSRP